MATILLNESDPVRHKLLRLRLQRQGHKVWSANHLNNIIATLHDVAIDLMILDLDQHCLDDLVVFADRWKGIIIVFQSSSSGPLQDFRSWMAEQIVYKVKNAENLSRVVTQLLQRKSQRPQKYNELKKGNTSVQMMVV